MNTLGSRASSTCGRAARAASRPLLQRGAWLLAAWLAAGCATAPGLVGPGATGGAPAASVEPGIVRVTHAELRRLEAGRPAPLESEQARRAWVDSLTDYLAERAARLLPEGQRLDVHLRGVQRAGSTEPWRGPQAADLRVVRDIYPPRIDLHFRLRKADGQVLREGERSLSDAAFLMRPNLHSRDDPLRYEKGLIDEWLRKEFEARRG
ncbi:DUF3016 domain-containing protein [Xenophilus arseniciresistens]|uniref:DUF3016 domain-containing protein n=1 Tax=Xenophilus arseniciresistens TaxID=1283306 RepID=A0AAE3NBU8_9BURK|nr:DUF3016 domain-containing protein [Xenophilus arseniciresistens]MDA7418698.1 DUF3016 domain-containing protein [Xenophilus arseniciresistens]